jgi:hypothetical protein
MKSALAVLALFLGQSEAFKMASLGYESEGVQVLVDTGSHIELGIKAEANSNTNTNATASAGAQVEMKQEA